jgi:cob(I)alamin adenosyltransferase
MALKAAVSGDYDIVICDEINNAVHHNLIPKSSIKTLIDKRSPKTSLCLTGRDFPEIYLPLVDIATNMAKIRHHFDDKYLANKGIDF